MSEDSTKQIFSDLFHYLEVLETQNAAMLQFLKDKKVIKESQFGSYLEQAAAATDVKWRAARVRMEHLLAEVPEPKAQPSEKGTKESSKTEQATAKSSKKPDGEVQAAEMKPASGDESGEKQSKPAANGTKEASRTEKGTAKTSEKKDGEVQAAAKKSAGGESGEKQSKPAAAERPQEGEPTPPSDQLEAKAQPDAKMGKTSQPPQENATAPEKKPAPDKQQASAESKSRPQGVENSESASGAKAEPQPASSAASKPEGQQEKPEEHAGKDAA